MDSGLVQFYSQSSLLGTSVDEFTAEERAVLERVNSRVAAVDTIAKLIDFVFDETATLFPCERVALAFFTENGERVSAGYARATYPAMYLGKGYSEDIAGSSLREVFTNGGVRLIRDLQKYLAQKPQSVSTRLMLKEGIRSSMTCALKVDERPVALLFRSSTKIDAYSEHHVRLHFAIAERLSQAVEKIWRIDQLQSTLRDYHEMLAFVSHELKSPLASIVLDGSAMLQGYTGELTDVQRERVKTMVNKSELLLGLVREYLDLTRIESGNLPLVMKADVDVVKQIVEPALSLMQTHIEQQGKELVRVFSKKTCEVTCDVDLMRIVMTNLLSNAVKYSHDKGRITVTVEPAGTGARVRVWNEGHGFREDQKSKLFHKFSRLPEAIGSTKRGTGVGLYTAWKIVHLHGGRIGADSHVGQWAEFTVEIPGAQG